MNMQVFVTFIAISFYLTSGVADGSDIDLDDFAKHVSFNQNVYGFDTATRCNQTEANIDCNRFGGFLANIKTDQVEDFFREEIVSNFLDYNVDYFKDMFWIGLHQVGDNNNLWEWSDGTPLQDGINNTHWYKREGYSTEPNDPSEHCVAVSTKRCKSSQLNTTNLHCDLSNNDAVARWGDLSCSTKNKFICENPYGSGFVSKETVVFGSTPIATLPNDSIDCTVFGDNNYNAIWYRNGSVVPNNTDGAIYQQQFDENTEYRTSTITFSNPLESDKGNYNCLIGKNTETSNNFTVKLRNLEIVTWVRNMSTPVNSTYAVGATIELRTSLIFHSDMEEYMYINLHQEDGWYMEMGNPDAPKVIWGWKCALFPGQNRNYECDYVEPPQLNARWGPVLVPKMTFRQEEAKPIRYGEIVTFHITITGVDTTEDEIEFKFTFDEQQIFYGNEEYTGNKIFVRECRKDIACDGNIIYRSTRLECGFDCEMVVACDINQRYQQGIASSSYCRKDATWDSNDKCPECHRSFEVMSHPPPVITFVSGDDIELLAILKFNNNPADHLEAVWDSTFNETRETFFNCSTRDVTLGCGISGDFANHFAGRTSHGYVDVIEYPKDYSFEVHLLDLISSDNGTVIEFSLVDPQSQLISIYTTKLVEKKIATTTTTVLNQETSAPKHVNQPDTDNQAIGSGSKVEATTVKEETKTEKDNIPQTDGTSATRPKLNFSFTLLLSFFVVALKL